MKLMSWLALATGALFGSACGSSDSSPSPVWDAGNASHDSGIPDAEHASDGGSVTDDGGRSDAGTDGGETSTPDGGGDNPFAAEMVRAHNDARQNVTPAPSRRIPDLIWSKRLADAAQKYSSHCRFEVSGGSFGENLFATSGGQPTPAGVVQGWAKQSADYDYISNSCASDKQCGNYTQVVWAASSELGCGRRVCAENSPFGDGKPWILWICSYNPPGNIAGEKPY